jgi:hypothetical protein
VQRDRLFKIFAQPPGRTFSKASDRGDFADRHVTDQIWAQAVGGYQGPCSYLGEAFPLQHPRNEPTDRRGMSFRRTFDHFFFFFQVGSRVVSVSQLIGFDHFGSRPKAGGAVWANKFTEPGKKSPAQTSKGPGGGTFARATRNASRG